jgi:uncharacterized protein
MEDIQAFVETLQLIPHPEGGFYREVYRSNELIPELDRNYLTSIYFLLTSENCSKFHRIMSDEIWYFHAGSPLTVHMLNEDGYTTQNVGLELDKNQLPQFTVTKGTIFGSTVSEPNSFSLVSCAVAPGFDFRDFKLFEKHELLEYYPEHAEIIARLT